MYNILLFAGTTEGRELAEYLSLCQEKVTVCVATEYGETLIPHKENLSVLAGRLDEAQMEKLFCEEQYDMVIDATHPYAQIVTENIVAACAATKIPYFRCLREESAGQENLLSGYDKLICVEDTAHAVEALEQIEGNILLTTGSKELVSYREVTGFQERFYPRVLPLEKVVHSCLELGVSPSHLIAMQGPFSQELNLAMIHQWNIACLVTKESGKAGGFAEKITAAKKAGIIILMIGRPEEKTSSHYAPEQLMQMLKEKFGIEKNRKPEGKKYFPKFVSLNGQRVQVFGGGKIAARRIETLLSFGAEVEVISPALGERCQELWENKKISWIEKSWQPGDCSGSMILAATNNSEINRAIVAECRQKGIESNRCDCREDCDFYFPAVVEKDGLVIGLCSNGADHKLVKEAAAELRKM